jgi:HPt (histidine-containing phosphotransfer) domain-containing protein
MSWQRIRGWITEIRSLLLKSGNPSATEQDIASPAADRGHARGKRDLPQETLGSVILARLLLELPQHRQHFLSAMQDRDYERLERCRHKLAGAVAYCELPQLSAALYELHQALKTDNAERIHHECSNAICCMTELMENSGIRQT